MVFTCRASLLRSIRGTSGRAGGNSGARVLTLRDCLILVFVVLDGQGEGRVRAVRAPWRGF